MTAGFPAAAARLMAARERVGARALEIAIADDPTFRDRHDEIGLRHLLRDTEVYIDRLAKSARQRRPELRPASGPIRSRRVYRRRRVPMDDMVRLSEGLRLATRTSLLRASAGRSSAALDEAIGSFRRFRRIAGDARKRNRLLQFLYKGA